MAKFLNSQNNGQILFPSFKRMAHANCEREKEPFFIKVETKFSHRFKKKLTGATLLKCGN